MSQSVNSFPWARGHCTVPTSTEGPTAGLTIHHTAMGRCQKQGEAHGSR
jgi:hypothetical protein